MDANWWNNALQSYDVGREHRADRENAQAFQDGGYDAVEQAAGRRGDLRTATQMRRFQDEERQQAYEHMQTVAPWARNVIRATRTMQPDQARGFLQQNAQRFLDFGLSPEQVSAGIAGLTDADPTVRQEWANTLDQAFSQHEDPEWRLDPASGQIWGVDSRGQYVEGGQGPAGLGREWRSATPEELRAAGAPAGTIMDVNIQSGERRVRRNPPAGRSAQGGSPQLPQGFQWEE